MVLRPIALPLSLAVGLLSVGIEASNALDLRKEMAPYRIVPSSGSIEIIAANPPRCGVSDMLAVQISTSDIYSGAVALIRALSTAHGDQLDDGCGFAARRPQDIPRSDSLSVVSLTRWVDESDIPALLKALKTVGDFDYADIISRESLRSDTERDIEAIKKRLREESALREDKDQRAGMKNVLRNLSLELTAQRPVRGRALVHVTLHGPLRSTDGSPQFYASTTNRLFFNTRKILLDAPRSPLYRLSAMELMAWGLNRERGGALGGIGALLVPAPGGSSVQVLGPSSPAAGAGLVNGDLVVSVNGESALGKSPDQVRSVLVGSSGSTVEVVVRRADSSEHRVKIARDSLIPSQDEITMVAERCSKAEDGPTRAYCLGALATNRARRDEAVSRLPELLADPSAETHVAGLMALIEEWRPTTVSGRRLPMIAMERQTPPFGCPAEGCSLLKTTNCLVLNSGLRYAGVKSISLRGPGLAADAEFGCGPGKNNEKVAFGSFCGLSTGTYTSTNLGCQGLKSQSTIVVIPGEQNLEVCAEGARSMFACSRERIDTSHLKGRLLELELKVAFSSGTVARCTKDEMCRNIVWPYGARCSWRTGSSVVFSASVPQTDARRLMIENRGFCGDGVETIGFKVKAGGQALSSSYSQLPAKGQIYFKYDLPDAGQVYHIVSTDSIVHVGAPFSMVVIQRKEFSKQEREAYRHQTLDPAGVPYWIGNDSGAFVFVDTGTISFAYPYSKTPDGSAIYRYDDGKWSVDAVSGQRMKRDEGVSTLSGGIIRSGVYAAFSRVKDDLPPETVASFLGSVRKEDGYYVASPQSNFELTATDPPVDGLASGVATTYFLIDGDGSEKYWVYNSPVPLPLGAHEIEYYSVDWSGNSEQKKKLTVLVTPAQPQRRRGDQVVGRDLLLGFMRSEPPAALEVQSGAEFEHTFWVASPSVSPALTVTNIGSTGIGIRNPQATLDIAGKEGEPDLLLRSGSYGGKSPGPQVVFGGQGEAVEAPAIVSRHGDRLDENAIDFGFYALPPDSLFRSMLSLQGGADGGGVQVCPVGKIDSELEVSDGRHLGDGTVRRLEAQSPATLDGVMDLVAMETARGRALRDVLSLRPVLFSGSMPGEVRRGLLTEESPDSVRGAGSTVLLTARLTNLELALQASLSQIEKLEKRLKAARANEEAK